MAADDEVLGNALAYARWDRYPVSPGHLLVIPRRHVAAYFELDAAEKRAVWQLVDAAQAQLVAAYEPAGWTVGINVGEAAGQTVMHVHVHLIPRYAGDVDEPAGGVRGVIPGKQTYGG